MRSALLVLLPSAGVVPDAPTIGTAVALDASATVDWDDNGAGSSAITSHDVEIEEDGVGGTIALDVGDSPPVTIEDLVNDLPYRFRVRAVNDAGNSDWSGWSNEVTPTEPVTRFSRPRSGVGLTALRRIARLSANYGGISAAFVDSGGDEEPPPPESLMDNIETNIADYPSGIPAYELYEVWFTIPQTTANNLLMPYSAAPPSGVTQLGISVDGLISNDGFVTTYRQPAFYGEVMTNESVGSVGTITQYSSLDWIYPTGTFRWRWRVAFPAPSGSSDLWEYKFEIRDSQGARTSDPVQVTVVTAAPGNRGPISVGSDARYFVHADGSYFHANGHHAPSTVDKTNPSLNASLLSTWQSHGMNFARLWLPPWGIWGATLGGWNSHLAAFATNDPQMGVYPLTHGALMPLAAGPAATAEYIDQVTPPTMPSGEDVVWWLNGDTRDFGGGSQFRYNPTRALGLNSPTVPVKPSTTYRLTVKYNAQAFEGPITGSGSSDVGWGVKTSSSALWHASDATQRAYYPGTGTLVWASWAPAGSTIIDDPNHAGWKIGTADLTTSSNQRFINYLYITLINVQSDAASEAADGSPIDCGHAFIREITLQEVLAGGALGPNVIYKPKSNAQLEPSAMRAYAFDYFLDLCRQNGVYLQLNITEKNDQCLGWLNFSGTTAISTSISGGSSATFYGDAREDGSGGHNPTKIRFLQKAWWRYCQARWGWSQHVLAWEFCNEGAISTAHETAIDEFAKYMKAGVFGNTTNLAHPLKRLTCGSFSSNAPTAFYADTANFPWLDIEQYHQYIDKTGGTGSTNSTTQFYDSRLNYVTTAAARGGSAAGVSQNGRPVVRGELGFGPASGQTDYLASGLDSGQFLHQLLWASLHYGGVVDQYFGNAPYLTHLIKTTATTHDWREEYGTLYDFMASDIPLANDHYVDLGASVSDADTLWVGQKDLTNNRAHGWVRNANFTWGSWTVSQGGTLPGITVTWDSSALVGTLTIPGLAATTQYDVYVIQFGTDTSILEEGTIQITTDGSGNLVLDQDAHIDPLCTDYAFKITGESVVGPVEVNWPMPGANNQRTSRIASGPTTDLSEIWAKPIEPYISPKVQPIAADGRIYISTAKGLYAFNADTGTEEWVYPTRLPLGHAPTYSNGTLYVGGMDRKLHAINATNGAQRWTFTAGGGITTNPLVQGTNVYFGARDGKLYAIRAHGQSGQGTPPVGWTHYQADAPILYSPAYHSDGRIYFGAGPKIYSINSATGAEVWVSATLPGQGFHAWWPVVTDDHVFATRTPESNSEFQLQAQHLFGTGGTNVDPDETPPGPTDIDPTTGHLRYDSTQNTAANFGDDAVAYFTTNPKRRTLFVLDRDTGAEVALAATSNYAPIMASGKTCNVYPPVVGADGTLYLRTANYAQATGTAPNISQGIPGALLVGWTVGSKYLTLPLSPISGQSGHWPQDEPIGISMAGEWVFWNVCSDRGGGLVHVTSSPASDSDNPNWPNHDATREFRIIDGRLPPMDNSAAGGTISTSMPHVSSTPDTTTPADYWNQHPQYFHHPDAGDPTVSGVMTKYHVEHGVTHAPAVYDGKFYVIRSNALIAFEAGGAGTSATVLAAAAAVDDGVVEPDAVVPADLLAELAAYIDTTLTAATADGGLRSGWLGVGVFMTPVDTYDNDLMDYWHQPALNMRILLRARALLVADGGYTSTVTAIDTFIADEYEPVAASASRVDASQIRHMGWSIGGDTPIGREGYDLWSQQTSGPSGSGRQNEPEIVYGLWKWYETYGGGSASTALTLFKRIDTEINVSVPGTNAEFAHRHNRYIAWGTGYLNLYNAAGRPSAGNGASQVPQAAIDKVTLLEGSDVGSLAEMRERRRNMTRDLIWPGDQINGTTSSYFSVGIHFWNFLYLTPELGQWLHDQDFDHVESVINGYSDNAPHWMIAHNEDVQLENGITPYHQAHALFQARALILQQDQVDLAKYLDSPICQVGDMFWIDNACAVLEAE